MASKTRGDKSMPEPHSSEGFFSMANNGSISCPRIFGTGVRTSYKSIRQLSCLDALAYRAIREGSRRNHIPDTQKNHAGTIQKSRAKTFGRFVVIDRSPETDIGMEPKLVDGLLLSSGCNGSSIV